MTDHGVPHPEVQVREHPLPGRARLFSLTLGDGTTLTIALDPDEQQRQLSVTPADRDEPVATIRMRDVEATTLAALLSGVRFAVDVSADQQPAHAVNLRTVTIGAGSPAVGRRPDEISPPGSTNAAVIAVIRDDTPELVEQDPERACQPGDRLVLVGRPSALGELATFLLG